MCTVFVLRAALLVCGLCENSSGDGNIVILFDDVFYSTQRRVLSKMQGRKRSIFAWDIATDNRRLHQSRCDIRRHCDLLRAAVQQ